MNSSGTGYSNEVSVTTLGPCPVVTNTAVSNIELSSAFVEGIIVSQAGSDIVDKGICWSKSPFPSTNDNKIALGSGSGNISSLMNDLRENTVYYVRAYATNKEGTGYSNIYPFCTNFIDIDQNICGTVTIGNQIWMTKNLNIKRFYNKDAIPEVKDSVAWQNLTTPAYCNYNNDTSISQTYGRLYNWFVVSDSRNICPFGWHVPSPVDFQHLIDFIGSNGASKLMETGTEHWIGPNANATNSTGFTALPSGNRDKYFDNKLRYNTYYWSSGVHCMYIDSKYSVYITSPFILVKINENNYETVSLKTPGFSVRCIHD